jgi:DNA-3-methyladenine glycosylase I
MRVLEYVYMKRCSWAEDHDALMCAYHDGEFGRRKHNDTELFEKLCLEMFQAGLSWRTVLYKREAFREVFLGFDAVRMAQMTEADTERLMADHRIIRNKRKIDAVIHNARMLCEQFGKTGSFWEYVYSFSDGGALCRDMRKRGFRFVGPTICDSFLGSVGAIEAHEPGCDYFGGPHPALDRYAARPGLQPGVE